MTTEKLPKRIASQVAFANGPANEQLGIDVAAHLGVDLWPMEFTRFADSEVRVRYEESIRGKLVIAFQSHAAVSGRSTADAFHTHLLMLDAATREDTERVIMVAPYFMGARQDRSTRPREAVTGALNFDLIGTAGITDFMGVDLHEERLYNAVKPANAHRISAQGLLSRMFAKIIEEHPDINFKVVSPDKGHSKVAEKHADDLGVGFVDLSKIRPHDKEEVSHQEYVEGLDGFGALMLEDMIGTASTLKSASQTMDNSGAVVQYVAATHFVSSAETAERIEGTNITKVFVTDTLPISSRDEQILGENGSNQLVVISAAEIIADGLKRVLMRYSVSEEHGPSTYGNT